MRQERELAEHVWYRVQTLVNISEPLFRLPEAKVLFLGVLGETAGRYGFGICGLVIGDGSVSFSIKPDNGFKLPLIMQWLKQTFSARLNVRTGRKGHVWGNRYWSLILEGEPPEWAEEADWGAIDKSANTPVAGAAAYILSWDSLRSPGMTITTRFSAKNAAKPASPTG
ncbi:MAG: hypothetical protein LBG27_09395 [Spirochaetaceae bacterium]|jgi:hypothetical protein|nr:hypothetical protein [Spirochaetaceae bacterium]